MVKKRKEKYIPADEVKTGETYYVKIGCVNMPVKVVRNRIEIKYPSGLYGLVSMKDLYKEV